MPRERRKIHFAEAFASNNPGEPKKEEPAKSSAEDADDYADGDAYISQVVTLIAQSTRHRDELGQWCRSEDGGGTDIASHVSDVYAACGITDLVSRAKLVSAAARRQQQQKQERKNRKQERMREAARAGMAEDEVAADGISARREEAAAAAKALLKSDGGAGDGAGSDSASAQDLKWVEVQAFKTEEEALRFVIECQPFAYQPMVPGDSSPFPSFDTNAEAYQHALHMDPRPCEFLCTETEFRRRLRIRQEEASEQKEAAGGKMFVLGRKSRQATMVFGSKHRDHPLPDSKPRNRRPWIVEAAGHIFQRPASLRALKEPGGRFYIAMLQEVERRVLVEGFRVKRRTSIPCSATKEDAINAFNRTLGETERLEKAKVGVLAVHITPEMGVEVVAKQEGGGFFIMARELPATCFSRLKRSGGGENT
mmetsp:Transcript_58335/g.164713  ORF Transcript_58335/g.164713 Transcript_58335/m.164713 type:complete len:424 (-) Transcript_58335:24-1295(-)